MNELYNNWLWSNAVPIETTTRKDPIGRIMVFALIVCAVHAIVWGM